MIKNLKAVVTPMAVLPSVFVEMDAEALKRQRSATIDRNGCPTMERWANNHLEDDGRVGKRAKATKQFLDQWDYHGGKVIVVAVVRDPETGNPRSYVCVGVVRDDSVPSRIALATFRWCANGVGDYQPLEAPAYRLVFNEDRRRTQRDCLEAMAVASEQSAYRELTRADRGYSRH